MAPGRARIDYSAVFAATPTPCLLLTPDLTICEVNQAYLRATGRERDELLHRHVFDAFPDHPEHPGADGVRNLRRSLERARDSGEPDRMDVQRYDIPVARTSPRRFEERYWSPVNTPVLGPDGATALLLHRVVDVTEALRAEAQRKASEQRFRALVEHASDLILVIGADGRPAYVSPSVARVLQHDRHALLALEWGDLVHPDDRLSAIDLLARAQRAPLGETVSGRLRVTTGEGAVRRLEFRATDHTGDPAICGVVLNARDITEQHEIEQALHRQALQDPLTGTPNRRWFVDAARQAIARAARTGRPVGVVLVDVDDFKLVNDSMGHAAGDRLLVGLAERMARALRPSDTVARLGGDEFVVLAEDLQHEHDAFTVARRVAAAGTGRYELGPVLVPRVTLSVGVSTGSGDTDPDTLLSHADAALYEAKRRGRDRVEVFDPALRRELEHRLRVEHELHRALAAGELALHWQPIVGARDGVIVGAEALLRWQHPGKGLLRPAEFLPVAEETGLLPRICAWVLEAAFAQAAAWQQLPAAPQVFINLAAQQLVAPSLPDEVSALAARARVDPARIRLEVSERLLTADLAAMRDQLVALRDRGFGIALDDFGAGNTALAWLQQLPIDVLKLDRRFTATLDDPACRAIVGAIVQLAPALGLASVAEGIETPVQLATMAQLGCDYAQGHHIALPQPANHLTEVLTAR